jgi:hypothetical protein
MAFIANYGVLLPNYAEQITNNDLPQTNIRDHIELFEQSWLLMMHG